MIKIDSPTRVSYNRTVVSAKQLSDDTVRRIIDLMLEKMNFVILKTVATGAQNYTEYSLEDKEDNS